MEEVKTSLTLKGGFSLTSWFREAASSGHALEWKVIRRLYQDQSPYQRIEVLELETFGIALILDGIMQTTSGDEFIYHEMLAHVPLLAHPRPQRVLIIGGGDGGLAREVLRHPEVEELTLVEIDRMVVEVAMKYLPEHTRALSDSRLVIRYADGSRFLKDTSNHRRFDVILVDSTDPEGTGPGRWLYTQAFHDDVLLSLRGEGIFAQQTGTPFFNPEVMTQVAQSLIQRFAWAGVYWAAVPSYPGGFFTFSVGSMGPQVSEPRRDLAEATKWYSSDVHRQAFVLPTYFKRRLPLSINRGVARERV